MSTAPPPTSTSTPPAPQSSALPPSGHDTPANAPHSSTTSSADTTKPVSPHRKPLLRLELRDLSSEGSRAFLRLLHASYTLEQAVDTVLRQLYSGLERHCIPPTRSITLVLRSMNGVAYTTGLDIDGDHKEIHLSTDYINSVPDGRKKEEMQGVIVHEMVHCWQHNALGTAPGGLIEGIADWVRLKAGFAPPHWKRRGDSNWDAGYERTGYFLEWLEEAHGADVVRRINDGLRNCEYESDAFWHSCCGKTVQHLWEEYKATLDREDGLAHGQASKVADGQTTTPDDTKSEPAVKDADSSATDGGTGPENPSDRASEDHKALRQQARRGGNMHVPIRPGTGS